MNRERLEAVLGHRFEATGHLRQALTHRSYGTPQNERLEFLGDSVLNCVVASVLYERYPDLREGELSRLRASLVRQDGLHRVAEAISLGDELLLGEGELKSGGARRPSILADALEAVIGAVFLDGGFAAARSAVLRLFAPLLDELDPSGPAKDAKTSLQEWLQSRRHPLPRYALRAARGEAHAQEFEVECRVEALGVVTVGVGASRRTAEQEAARRALDELSR